MGLLQRITTLISGGINAVIDSQEDEVKTLMVIRARVAKSKAEVMQVVAAAMAEYKIEHQKYALVQKQVNVWHSNATNSLTAGRQNLAQAALVRKREFSLQADAMAASLQIKGQRIEELKTKLQEIVQSLSGLDGKIQDLSTRASVIKANEKLQTTSRLNQEIQRIDEKLTRKEARIDANAELNQLFANPEKEYFALQQAAAVDSELVAIKRELGLIEAAPIAQLPQSIAPQIPQASSIPAIANTPVAPELLAEQIRLLEQQLEMPSAPTASQSSNLGSAGIHIKSSTNITW